MAKIIDHIRLLRPWQWYKNLLIAVPLVFGYKLFEINSYPKIITGFISLCLASSAVYVINDIKDVEKDRHHPIKKQRPLASGNVKIHSAFMISISLVVASLFTSLFLTRNIPFTTTVFIFLVNSLLYTTYFKNKPIADIVIISINYIIRSSSGAILLNIYVSPWLILGTFFLAMIILIGKRISEIKRLQNKAPNHRPVYKYYTREFLEKMFNITAGILILTYAIYCTEHPYKSHYLPLTLPIAFYSIFRYLYLIETNYEMGEEPHKLVKDIPLLLSNTLWLFSVILILYYI